MRQRWGARPSDPGRLARPRGAGDRLAPGRRLGLDERIKRLFLARESVIDCPHEECRGLFVTATREVQRQPGTGARVVLRCTREPDEHEVIMMMAPYSEEEQESLGGELSQGEAPECARCGTSLQRAGEESRRSGGGYHCPWCGVRFTPSVAGRREVR